MADVTPEVLAIRYGSVSTTRSASFLDYGGYDEPDAPLDMDYFFWVIRVRGETIVVDTGFDSAVGTRRGRRLHVEPVQALARLGVQPDEVSHLVITHFHYDHIGNAGSFSAAQISFQRAEYEFWLDRGSLKARDAALVEQNEIDYLQSAVASGRARCLDGDTELVPGVSARLVGGHTPGQQVVVVEADRHRVVLAADAVHFYEEIELDRPYLVADNPAAMRTTYRQLRHMESDGAVVVAGHDPRVMTRFPAVPEHGPDLVVRISP